MALGFDSLSATTVSDSSGGTSTTLPASGPTLNFDGVAGQTYWIAVDGQDGDYGDVKISIADLGDPGSATLPAGATFSLDFVNQRYIYGATTYTVDQVLSQPWRVLPGVGTLSNAFERATIGTTSSLVPGVTDAHVCKLLSPFADVLLTGSFTVVVEFSAFTGGHIPLDIISPKFYETGSTPGAITDWNAFWIEWDDTYPAVFEYDPANVGTFGPERDCYFDQTGNEMPFDRVCVAVTRTDARVAASWNGRAITIGDNSNENAIQSFAAAGLSIVEVAGQGSVARIVVYPPQADAVLPTLSDISTRVSQPPTNDNFASAATVTVGQNVGYHNWNATVEASEPTPWGAVSTNGPYQHTVWFKFVAPETRNYQIDTFKSNVIDLTGVLLAVYTGTALNNLVLVDQYPAAGQQLFTAGLSSGLNEAATEYALFPLDQPYFSKVTISATAGVTYYIMVDTRDQDLARIVLNITAQ